MRDAGEVASLSAFWGEGGLRLGGGGWLKGMFEWVSMCVPVGAPYVAVEVVQI